MKYTLLSLISPTQKIAANSKDDKAVFVKFLYVLRARQVRVRPVKYVANKCIRIELYGCPSSSKCTQAHYFAFVLEFN